MRIERRGALHEVSEGARAVVDGLTFVFRSAHLLKSALMPALTAAGVGMALAGVGLWAVVRASAVVVGATGRFAAVGRALFDVTFGALVLFVAAVVTLAIAQPLARGALERLTGELSRSLGLVTTGRPSSRLLASMGTALAALGVTLPTIGVIELVTALAPEAALLTEPLAFLVSALGLAWDLFDHPMSKLGWGARDRLRWMRQNGLLVLGFALASQALLMFPVVDLLLLPVGILGATRLVAMRPGMRPEMQRGNTEPPRELPPPGR